MGLTEEAINLVNGERQADYGSPIQNFTIIADLMSAAGFRFQDPTKGLRNIEPKDVPIFMILTKISREVYKHKQDNLTDIAGYIKTLEDVHNAKTPL